MITDNISIGIDIEKISRFQGKTIELDEKFLYRIFTQSELEYCFSKANPAPHLAVRYCAKEAVVKALTGFDIKDVFYSDIEIFKNENNVPFAIVKKYPDITLKISLSHSSDNAIAYAMAIR